MLHIIKHALDLMYLDYCHCHCHQILYKSIIPFSSFAIWTKCFQKVQLPAALLMRFLCAGCTDRLLHKWSTFFH